MKINNALLDIDYIESQIKDVYSTSEVKTNKVWIDNKPIYRKCITGTTPSTSTYGTVSVGITNLETMTEMTGVMDRGDGYAVPMPLNTPEFDCAYRFSSGAFITHPVANSYMDCPYRVIFEYTKTTD